MIALIGFTGAGKTTLGLELACKYGVMCYDIDRLIELGTGRLIREIFETDGEAAFRRLEEDMITEIVNRGQFCVMVTGGGAVLSLSTRERLRSSCFVVHVTAPLNEIMNRLSRDQSRPLLQGDNPRAALERLFAAREHAYDFAHARVETVNVDAAAKTVLGKWMKWTYEHGECVS